MHVNKKQTRNEKPRRSTEKMKYYSGARPARRHNKVDHERICRKRVSNVFPAVYSCFNRTNRDRKEKLLDKLSSHDYFGALRRIRKKRHGKTSSWLSESKSFID